MLHLLLCVYGSGTSFFTVSFLCCSVILSSVSLIVFPVISIYAVGPISEFFISHFFAETLPFFICFKPIYDSCCSIFMLVALKSLSDNSHICFILLVSVNLPFLIHFEILALVTMPDFQLYPGHFESYVTRL